MVTFNTGPTAAEDWLPLTFPPKGEGRGEGKRGKGKGKEGKKSDLTPEVKYCHCMLETSVFFDASWFVFGRHFFGSQGEWVSEWVSYVYLYTAPKKTESLGAEGR